MKSTGEQPRVGIIMGSRSDLAVMSEAAEVLEALGVSYELTVVSAHRTPRRMVEYAENAARRGLRVIVAGAGGAAHLPGMVAALTPLPVIGVPIRSSNSIAGIDSLLSIVQMPPGVPVAAVAINGARNAGILAAQILGSADAALRRRLEEYKDAMRADVETTVKEIAAKGYRSLIDQVKAAAKARAKA